MTDQALAEMFRHFARREFRGHSPLYERLSEFLADRRTWPGGQWLEWDPAEYAYEPVT